MVSSILMKAPLVRLSLADARAPLQGWSAAAGRRLRIRSSIAWHNRSASNEKGPLAWRISSSNAIFQDGGTAGPVT
jgi:hypothetical protein